MEEGEREVYGKVEIFAAWPDGRRWGHVARSNDHHLHQSTTASERTNQSTLYLIFGRQASQR